jgi:hypothetical protein
MQRTKPKLGLAGEGTMAERTHDELERGRRLYEQRSWLEAHQSLVRADRADPLAPEDLELLATAAYMLGDDDEQESALERAHRGRLARGERLAAVRSAFWLGVFLMLRREIAELAPFPLTPAV